MKHLGIFYGIAGGVLSFVAFIILQNLLMATDTQGFILIGTVILSTVICCCTGMLIETYRDKNINRKE
ncbi:hypothetical protein [Caldicoprobacter faecalis]|uniref:Uncharacterized protein n=1 Tax=Caldicoprobacter faecalis TaxID=937334 RepID=A0A1I5STU8_9FIRM|nr:hypothetical protein [Caldicoprobacter faecalis]SFP74169.1 hypothetical protein SAMN05444406_10353 [Caldicoprobacter faecalis]